MGTAQMLQSGTGCQVGLSAGGEVLCSAKPHRANSRGSLHVANSDYSRCSTHAASGAGSDGTCSFLSLLDQFAVIAHMPVAAAAI